ncbi:MAG: hypothetical protein PQ612_02455 [Rickettsiales bacterium]|nr:hypothetical protein [Pseudomonadota bacterium]MDA0966026.1 hypothetical protein [Pseudomonadota bacterium]MDG4542503.1 hypothetical protein [Rickettsiales bacterium]MDG4545007.1 hypothetical protein [Rickettsiales bacterium]MDG4547130.1 hypothetical protein [Rickettsiales bacterium]
MPEENKPLFKIDSDKLARQLNGFATTTFNANPSLLAVRDSFAEAALASSSEYPKMQKNEDGTVLYRGAARGATGREDDRAYNDGWIPPVFSGQEPWQAKSDSLFSQLTGLYLNTAYVNDTAVRSSQRGDSGNMMGATGGLISASYHPDKAATYAGKSDDGRVYAIYPDKYVDTSYHNDKESYDPKSSEYEAAPLSAPGSSVAFSFKPDWNDDGELKATDLTVNPYASKDTLSKVIIDRKMVEALSPDGLRALKDAGVRMDSDKDRSEEYESRFADTKQQQASRVEERKGKWQKRIDDQRIQSLDRAINDFEKNFGPS